MTDRAAEQRRLQHFVCSQSISIILFVSMFSAFFFLGRRCGDGRAVAGESRNLCSMRIGRAAQEGRSKGAGNKTDEREFNW